jgi:DOR family
MFNSLFNSLFGKTNENTDLNTSDDNKSSQESDQKFCVKEIDGNVTAIFLEEDKDWLFVEREVDGEDSNSIAKSPNNLQLVPFQSILSRLESISEYDDNSYLSANLPSLYPSSMDDSWFLTPPECFSSVSSIQLESSPLENLLIEHPSMSVYYNFRRGYNNAVANHDSVIDDLVVLELSQNDIFEEQTEKVDNLHSYLSISIPLIFLSLS